MNPSIIKELLPNLPDVYIRPDAITSFASKIEKHQLQLPTWRGTAFPLEDSGATASLLVVANSINFSFWGNPKWTVHYKGHTLDGSIGLFAAFTRALDDGVPILDGSYLASLASNDLNELLRGPVEIPMFETRLQILRETGRILVNSYNGNPLKFIESANQDAPYFVQLLTEIFPSFNDSTCYNTFTISFQKRAQLAAAMLYARFRGKLWGTFRNIDKLTLFADYKIPQILRELGILSYSPHLSTQVDQQIQIPENSPEEIQIRLATLASGEAILNALRPRFPKVTALQIDSLLWTATQRYDKPMRFYHRTRTKNY